MNPYRRWSEFNTSNDSDYRKRVAKERKFLGIEDSVPSLPQTISLISEVESLKIQDDSVFVPAASEKEIRLEGFERFELYSIEVQHLEKDREFLTIHVDSPWRGQTIYRRNENEEISTGKPLILSGPFRPMLSSDPIFIWFGDLKWRWEVYKFTQIPYNPSEVHPEGVITESVNDTTVIEDDNRIPSCVTIRYEWLNESVEANFRFMFAGDDIPGRRSIEIISGIISVTTDGRSETERILRFFPVKKKNNRRRRKKKVENDNRRFLPGDIILLDRGIIAMPMNSKLHVSVDFVYCGYNHGVRVTEEMIMKGSRSINVPKNPGVTKFSFSANDSHLFPTLNLEVDWSDEVYPFSLCSGRKKIPSLKSSVKPIDNDSFDFFPDPTESEDFELFPDPNEA